MKANRYTIFVVALLGILLFHSTHSTAVETTKVTISDCHFLTKFQTPPLFSDYSSAPFSDLGIDDDEEVEDLFSRKKNSTKDGANLYFIQSHLKQNSKRLNISSLAKSNFFILRTSHLILLKVFRI